MKSKKTDGRPRKDTIEYFSHDVTKLREIAILQKRFGHDRGYRVYFELMELLGRSPNQILQYNETYDKIYIAEQLRIEIDELAEILTFMTGLDILCLDCFNKGFLFSDMLMQRLVKLYNKRKNNLPRHVCGRITERDNNTKEISIEGSEAMA